MPQPASQPAEMAAGAAADYVRRAARAAAEAAVLAARSRRLSYLRLGAAALAVVGIVLIATGRGGLTAAVLVTLGPGLFIALAIHHAGVERRREHAAGYAVLNREALARLERRWDDLPAPWQPGPLDDHPYASDLDVFGHASIVQLAGPVHTPTGRRTLASWLLDLDRASPTAVRDRQAAVAELAPALDFRQDLTLAARATPRDAGEHELGAFVAWAEGDSWLLARPWISILAVALGVATLAGAILYYGEWIEGPWFAITATLGWLLRAYVQTPLEATNAGAGGERALRGWSALVRLVGAQRWHSGPLAEAHAVLEGGDVRDALRRLEDGVALADFRLSTWLYLPVQTITLWDLHVWWALEIWRRRHGRQVRGWLEAIGHVEALSALASLAHDHPGWAFPTVLDAPPAEALRLDATALGHALLPNGTRVCNDVTIGPKGRFLLVTGSNMSGKSTLMRSVGVNVVLAHAGAPVCATSMQLPLVALHTSMRVADSLERGLSLFMASLVRLERIVRAARDAGQARPVCYLLDEVLQGTNSAERRVAVRTIVDHLLASWAIGVVTTHDLDLARDPAFAANATSVHLQETLTGEGDAVTMTFDYTLRPGPAAGGNALQLLRLLGLQ
ncbi:MAG: DNA mismatch repair protein MutS [Vicinamibacteraceae bacterium]